MTQESFGTMPIRKLFFKLAIPGLIGMITSSFMIMIDGIVVGNYIGMEALAGINIVFPILTIIYAAADMVAVGAGVKISIKLGEGKGKDASRLFSSSLLIIAAFGVGMAIFSILFLEDLIIALISDRNLSTFVIDYAGVTTLFLPITMPFFALDNYYRICGKAKLSMSINILLSVTNIILDIFFIAHLGLGISSAALASSLSVSLGTIIFLVIVILNKISLKFTLPKISIKEIAEIIYNGASEFLSSMSGSLMAVFINGVLLYLAGSIGVASFSILMYIDSLMIMMIFGMTDAIQPVVGYNYGMKNKKRIDETTKIAGVTAATLSAVVLCILLAFPSELVKLFSKESDRGVSTMATTAILLYAPSYLFTWYNMIASAVLTSMERAKESITIMMARTILFPLLVIFATSGILEENSVFIAPTISSGLTAIMSCYFMKKQRKRLEEMVKVD